MGVQAVTCVSAFVKIFQCKFIATIGFIEDLKKYVGLTD